MSAPAAALRPHVAGSMLAAAGLTALLLREGYATVPALALLYVALGSASLVVATPCDRDPAPLPALAVAAAGICAVIATRALPGVGLPVAAGAVAQVVNVGAAVAEEAFFRRFLYSRLVRHGAAVAIAGSAAAFALVHLPGYGIAALPVNAGAGLLLSWQRWASGRWEVSAGTHAFANVVATL